MESDEDSQAGLARSLTLRLRTPPGRHLSMGPTRARVGWGHEAKEATPNSACACLLAPTCWVDWLKADDVDRTRSNGLNPGGLSSISKAVFGATDEVRLHTPWQSTRQCYSAKRLPASRREKRQNARSKGPRHSFGPLSLLGKAVLHGSMLDGR